MATVFDGPNLLITLSAPTAGLLSVDVQNELYSDWKEWVKTVGHQYEPAFDTTAGDPTQGNESLTPVFFLRNDLGWRIQTTDADQEVSLVGDIYARDASLPIFESRPGRTIFIAIDRSTSPRVITDAQVERIVRAVAYRQYTNAATGNLDIYDDTDTLIESVPIYEDDGITQWDGAGPIVRRNKIS